MSNSDVNELQAERRAVRAIEAAGGVEVGFISANRDSLGVERRVFQFGGRGQRSSFYALEGSRSTQFDLRRIRATEFER